MASVSSKRSIYLRLAVSAAVALGLIVAMLWASQQREPAGTVGSQPKLGGLVDQFGRPFDPSLLAGRYKLVYFGFTQCPDACPTALIQLAAALDELGSIAGRVQPIMVTVDPERDTPQRLGLYLQHFGGGFLGLTGPSAAVERVAGGFGVYLARQPASETPGQYNVDHSNEFFLLGPDGTLLLRIPATLPRADLVARLRTLLDVVAT